MHASAQRSIAVIVKHEIGVASRTMQPAVDLALILANRGSDCHLCSCLVAVRGIGRELFFFQTLAQFDVGLTDMTLHRMSAASFVTGKIVAIPGAECSVDRRFR